MRRRLSFPTQQVQKRVPFNDTATLGAIVASTRKNQKLTQIELAEFAGVGLTFVNQLERGKETVRLELVLKVLKALNIQPELKLPEFQDD